MKFKKTMFCLALIAVTLISPASPETYATEPVKNLYKLDLNDFHELRVNDGVNVDYRCSEDSAGTAVFECKEDIASMLMFANDNGRLTVQLAPEAVSLNGQNLPVVTVYSAFLQKAENSGDSTLRVLSPMPTAKIKFTVIGNGVIVASGVKAHEVNASINTGSGHIVLSGEARKAAYQNIGTGPIEAGMLKARNVTCKMLGTGPIDCYASESIKIMGMGSGKVIYDGNPSKVINRSIGVKIINLNADTQQSEAGE